MRYVVKSLFVSIFMLVPAVAWGAHPLITDDTGTQGKGKFQVEEKGCLAGAVGAKNHGAAAPPDGQ